MTKAQAKQPNGAQSAPATGVGAGGKPGPGPRRTATGKEIIPLAWKLVGTSAGTPVTLLKCIDRKDAEAQMERLKVEGYYQSLGIFPADARIPLSPTLERAKKRAMQVAFKETESAKTVAGSKTAKPKTKKAARSTKTTASVTRIASKPQSKKAPKPPAKSAKKAKKVKKKSTRKAANKPAAKTAAKTAKKSARKKAKTAKPAATKKKPTRKR